jgi:fluoroacetyl-CoA thioesterase
MLQNDGGADRSGAGGGTLEAGIEATQEFEVVDDLLTDVGGTLGSEVLSTPGMIKMMERTAAMLVFPRLAQGKATVGFEVCVKHVGAAAKGSHCTARARLEEVQDNRKLRFSVEVVSEDRRTIGVGTHERRVIDAQGHGGTKDACPTK